MKRILTGLCVLALLLGIAALAESDGWALAIGDVCIYAQPDVSTPLAAMAPAGSELEYLGQTAYDAGGGVWYDVSWKGQSGWVSAKDVELKWATLY